ncbi:class I mannose-6-phosphate isomerase [Alloacidobacterium dinghuense]|uniref:Class I mannose-6-phosphate isomerase n=1 Tax=Alloacidobacterium dinghuense TaxID=2763107 RepID=A0A7G8BP80_9BACT|nr:type I phosphomannose isomerase catalytic subunit [Alloacidobacterium dinghuense]QNI34350.1 class I mannose-6-phosphate isomerase [Alloacidobacterium dinghuense]
MQGFTPFRLSPYFRTRVWGFNDLSPWYDFKTDGEPIGEVWLTGEMCVAETGPLKGQSLKEITAVHGEALLGQGRAGQEFPLLIKVLFPKEKLSVQVHPDDTLAQKYGEPRGKTECWYALDAQPGAEVALGIKPGTPIEQVRAAIAESRLEELLACVPVNKGDMIFVDAGTVHAIGPGAVLLETQQTSDLTYRMYDYGRPRELHLDKSFEAMRLTTGSGKMTPKKMNGHSVLLDQKYFRVEQWKGTLPSVENAFADGVQLLFVADGRLKIEGAGFEAFSLNRCQLAVIPAGARDWKITPEAGAEVIRILPQSA